MEEYLESVGRYAKRPIAPNNKIVITEDRFCFDEPIVFKLNEQFFSFSNDDFTIKDINGVGYFKCEGKFISIKDRKVLYDLYNQPILNMKDKLLSLRGKMNIYEGKTEEKEILKITPKSPIFNKKLTINFFNKATGKEEFIEMRCDIEGYNCKFFYGKKKEGAPMVAKVTRRINFKSMATNNEDYYVDVAPGVDTAAVIALAICFDENKNDSSFNILDAFL